MRDLLLFCCFLIISTSLFSQGESLFNDSELHEIRFEMVDSSIFISTKEYQMVNIMIDGIMIDSIGFKKKGNISAGHQNNKFPFKVKTNKYVNGKKYDGIKEFTLHNNYQDPSMLREKMTYDLCNELGLHSLKTAFAKVYINGNYWGLYTLLEAKDELYKRVFDNKDGAVLESLDFGSMCFAGDSKEDYYYELFEDYIYKIDNGDEELAWEHFPTMLDKANNTEASDYMTTVPDYLNIKDFIKYQALNVYLLNFDSYIGFLGNQLYFFDESTEVWEVIPWDFNASFGLWNTNNYRPFDYELIPNSISNGCIASKINDVSELEHYYLSTMCSLVNQLADTIHLNNVVDSWRAQIEEAVFLDNRKEFDNARFEEAMNYGYFSHGWEEFVPGMKTFIEDRWNFINNALEMQDVDCSLLNEQINETSELLWQIFPNPTTNDIRIEVPDKSDYNIHQVELYNFRGQKLFKSETIQQSSYELSLRNLDAGFYVVKVFYSENEYFLEKIIRM